MPRPATPRLIDFRRRQGLVQAHVGDATLTTWKARVPGARHRVTLAEVRPS